MEAAIQFKPLTTLRRARGIFAALVRGGETVICPTCDRSDRLYSRALSGTMARAMIALWHEAGTGYAKMTDVLSGADIRGGDYAKGKFWDFIQPAPVIPGQNNSGFWKLTDAGVEFVHGRLKAQAKAIVWRDQLLEFEGPMVDIRDVLGTEFDYAELMLPAESDNDLFDPMTEEEEEDN